MMDEDRVIYVWGAAGRGGFSPEEAHGLLHVSGSLSKELWARLAPNFVLDFFGARGREVTIFGGSYRGFVSFCQSFGVPKKLV
jgi:hypothetical protein